MSDTEPCCTACRLAGESPAPESDRPLLRVEPWEVAIVAYPASRDGLPDGPPIASHRPTRSWVTYGRVGGNDLVLRDDSKLSRRQGGFHFHEGRVFVVDTDSACGTWLDGASVSAAPLREGSVVLVGDTVLRIERA